MLKTWHQLPQVMLSLAAGFLSPRDVAEFRNVCTHWRCARAAWKRVTLTSTRILDMCVPTLVFEVNIDACLVGQWLQRFSNVRHMRITNVSTDVLETLGSMTDLLQDVELILEVQPSPEMSCSNNWPYLRKLPHIEEFHGISVITDEALCCLRESNLRRLRLIRNQRVSDQGMTYVGEMSSLESFTLTGGPVTSIGLERISGLHQLQALHLRNVPISANNLLLFSNLRGLEALSLIKCGLTDETGNVLRKFTGLRELAVEDCPILDESFLKPLRCLRILSLRRTWVTGGDPLRCLTRLQDLSLKSCYVLSSLKNLSGLTGLQKLDLDFCSLVPDEDMSYLQNLSALVTLNCKKCPLTHLGIRYLQWLPALRTLSLDSFHITDEGLCAISKISSLRSLSVLHATITDQGINALRELKFLEYLNMGLCSVTSCVDDPFAGFDHLQLLVLPNGNVLSFELV